MSRARRRLRGGLETLLPGPPGPGFTRPCGSVAAIAPSALLQVNAVLRARTALDPPDTKAPSVGSLLTCPQPRPWDTGGEVVSVGALCLTDSVVARARG